MEIEKKRYENIKELLIKLVDIENILQQTEIDQELFLPFN